MWKLYRAASRPITDFNFKFMASTFHRLGFTAARYAYRRSAGRHISIPEPVIRHFHPTPFARARRADGETSDHGAEPPADADRQPFEFKLEDLAPEEKDAYLGLNPDQQADWREESEIMHNMMNSPEYTSEMNAEASLAANSLLDAMPHMPPPAKLRPDQIGFLAEAEDDADDVGEDPEFEGDDITSLAHGELEQHRELRQYARLAVWEMPLLYSMQLP